MSEAISPSRQVMLFICRKAPYDNCYGTACMDLLLTAAAFDQDITLVFTGAGVLYLAAGQDSNGIGLKNLSKIFPSLNLFEVEKVLVDSESLDEFGLTLEGLVIPARQLTQTELGQLMETADQILHTVNKSPANGTALQDCLALAQSGSAILLLEDGVYGAMDTVANRRTFAAAQDKSLALFALEADLTARGIGTDILSGFEIADYPRFVELCLQYSKVVSWF